MKALFLADLYQLWINFKFYGGFLLVALGITAFSSGDNNLGTFFPMYAVLMCSMMGMSLVQLDEASHWNLYAQALPATRKDQVSSKYAFTLICFGVVLVLFAVLFVILALLGRMTWAMAGVQTAVLAVLGLLAPAFSMPAMFRWGSNKGRVIFLAVIIAVSCGAGVFFSAFPFDSSGLPDLPVPVLIALAALIPVALFIGSWTLAVRWYEKRDL